jgi:hypothetical protein
MTLPPLTTETCALLAAIVPAKGKITTERTDAIYATVEPIQSAMEDVLSRINAVDRLRRAADRTEEAGYAYSFFERIKQTVGAADRQCKDALASLDALTDTLFQMDRYGLEMQHSLVTHDERMAATAAARAGRVILSTAEYETLVANAERGKSADKVL